jgi:hypothetical protein
MTCVYRSPNVFIEQHEWHVLVSRKKGRVAIVYRFRPLSNKPLQWQNRIEWVGPMPRDWKRKMGTYQKHARDTVEREKMRDAAIKFAASLNTPELVNNPGQPELVAA